MSVEGAYLMIDKENYEEYLKAVGSEPALLEKSVQVTEMENFKVIGENEYRVKTYSSDFDTYVVRFRLGREINEVLWDGRKVKTIFVFETANKLVQTQVNVETEIKGTIVREFDHDNKAMNMTLTCGDVIATISYQKLKITKGSKQAELENSKKADDKPDENNSSKKAEPEPSNGSEI